jgi:arginine repressor
MTTAGRPAAPATKTARQARIVAILSREQVHSQEQLAGLLAQYAGLHVAQATLSRDLDELGVVRLRAADGALVYALPGDPGGPGSRPGTGIETSNYPERTGAARDGSGPDAGPGDADVSAPVGPGTRPHGGAGGGAPVGGEGGGGEGGGPSADAAADPLSRTAAGPGPDAAGPNGGTPAEPAGQSPRPASGVGGGVSARFTRYLKELLTSAEGSANIVVLRTPAGAAQFLASTIDHAAWPAILGTVAGDDTVLVIARDPAGGEALAAEFRQLAEGRRLGPSVICRLRRRPARVLSPAPATRPGSVAYASDTNRRGRWRS